MKTPFITLAINYRTHRERMQRLHSVRNMSLGRNFIFTTIFAAVILQSCSITRMSKKSQAGSGTRINPISLKANADSLSYLFGYDFGYIFADILEDEDVKMLNYDAMGKAAREAIRDDGMDNETKNEECRQFFINYFLEENRDEDSVNSLNYCMGYMLGDQISKYVRFEDELKSLNYDVIFRGMQDVIKDRENREEIKNTHKKYRMFFERYTDEKRTYDEEKNLREGRAFLEANGKRRRRNVVSLPSGLQYRIISNGEGVKPTVEDKVEISYHGTLIDGTVFERGTMEFKVSALTQGLSEALTLMNEGSVWEVFISPKLYGNYYRDNIPPNSVLIFKIDLVKVIKEDEEIEMAALAQEIEELRTGHNITRRLEAGGNHWYRIVAKANGTLDFRTTIFTKTADPDTNIDIELYYERDGNLVVVKNDDRQDYYDSSGVRYRISLEAESGMVYYVKAIGFGPYQFRAQHERAFSALNGTITLKLSEGGNFPCIGIQFGDKILNRGFGTYMEIKKQGDFYVMKYRYKEKKYANMADGIEEVLRDDHIIDFYERENQQERGKKVWEAFVEEDGLQFFIDFVNEIIDDEFLDSPFNTIYG